MKRLIYITYLSLLALILISCEKEMVAPENAAMAASPDRRATCQEYSFTNINGFFNLGTAVGNEVIVGFNGTVSLQQQQQIFRQFKEIKGIIGPMNTESGEVTIVELRPGTNCAKTDKLIQGLENIASVRFALPGLQDGTYWDEFYVFLAPTATEADLVQLTLSTNTKIVADPTVTGFGAYMISADKLSAGNVFEMITLFSQSPIIEVAEPNGPIFPI
jgi:hypothetical protein